MHRLHNQRKGLLTVLVGISIATHGFVLQNLGWLKGLLGGNGTSPFEFLLTGGTLYAAIVALPLTLYDKILWKVINPKFDFSGEWIVRVTAIQPISAAQVTEAGLSHAEDIAADIMSADGTARIEQTLDRIWIEEASGPTIDKRRKNDVVWTAEVIPLKMPGEILVVFESVTDRAVSGRDHLVVKSRSWLGRPLHLIGSAFHIFPNVDFTIKADIEYVRKAKRIWNRNALSPTPHLPSASHVRARSHGDE
mgnify:CR=1 FL=1